MIQNKYHGKCSDCGKIVKPFEGFIKRAARGDGWLFKHQSCVKALEPVLGKASQPVRAPETRVCIKCDKRKPLAQFSGFTRCNECRAIESLRYLS